MAPCGNFELDVWLLAKPLPRTRPTKTLCRPCAEGGPCVVEGPCAGHRGHFGFFGGACPKSMVKPKGYITFVNVTDPIHKSLVTRLHFALVNGETHVILDIDYIHF